MTRRRFEFDNFVIADDTAPAILDLSLNKRVSQAENDVRLLENIRARLDILLAEEQKNTLKLVRMILKELSPALLDQNSLAVVSRFIADNFPALGAQKVLDFYLAPEMFVRIRPFLAEEAGRRGYGGRIVLHRDKTLAPYDCRIVWEQGDVSFNGREKIRLLEKMLTGEQDG